jgi:TRAP-type C4-dicarboxylate transport system substrate-binding protein
MKYIVNKNFNYMEENMRRIKMFGCLVLVFVLIATMFTGCGKGDGETGSVDETYELSWAGIGSTDSIDTWIAEEASTRIAEKTDGHVKINVYPSSQLGDLSQAYDDIMRGSIDMGLFTIYGTHDTKVEVLYMPFLTSNFEEFKEVYGVGTDMFESFSALQAESGIKTFGFWPSGYLGLGFADLADTEEVFDFTADKQDLVRVPGMEVMVKSVEAMGFNTTVIPYSDVYTSLQTGVIDGSANGGPYANYNSFRDVLNYYVDYRVVNDVYSCIMNDEKFNSLPEEYQLAITSVIDEVLDESIDMISEQEAQALKDLEEAGIEVIIPTDEQRLAMKEYIIENVWPEIAYMYDEELVKSLMNQ